MAQRTSHVPVGCTRIKAIKRVRQPCVYDQHETQDKKEPTISSPTKAHQLEDPTEVDVCILSVSGDVLREETIRSDRPVMDLALPWCQILDGDYKEISPACMIGEVAKGESTATITLVQHVDFRVDWAWENQSYVKVVLGHHLNSTTDARHIARALEIITQTQPYFNEESGDFAVEYLRNLKAACHQEASVPEDFLLLRPFLQSMLRCFRCGQVASHANQSCNVNGYSLKWTCKGVQCWKKACFTQRGQGSAFQKMKETLKDLVEVSLVGGPECAGAWRDRYTFEERSRLPLPAELAEARFLRDLQIQRFWELFYEQRALR